ncbi:T9SS type A sorting domain-containing protein [Dyadobacter sandarakinus]|uniref:T9SS type A sorting domain-containing protein n=1 Tax=Dyadobacter sandarakinus TaxID=2747268 RepID=A0ABX7I5N1_9BACT|nr:T9SS type A sorting domain-containing protein [Dyadobacter sandarakinus]QRR00847.1 T9SS type A sorting domain-containing protein [Dyadobacter sandarakinus]
MRVFYKSLMLFLLTVGLSHAQTAIFVKEGALGTGNSWDDATGTIPTGTLAAGTRIYIAAGTYTVSSTTELSEGDILIQGGFWPGSAGTDLTSNSPGKYPTHILMEDGNSISFYSAQQTNAEDISNVVDIKGIDYAGQIPDQSLPSGGLFLQTEGYGSYTFTDISLHDFSTSQGAVYVGLRGSTFTFERCNFYNLKGLQGPAGILLTGYAAMEFSSPTKLIVSNSTFSNNSGSGGTAVSVYNAGAGYNEVRIEGSVFCNNFSDGGGGALYAYSSSLTVNDCSFTGNNARFRGGAIGLYQAQLVSNNCRFYYNLSYADGGVIFAEKSLNEDGSVVADAVFYKNRASRGGAVGTFNAGNWNFVRSRFVNNFTMYKEQGGAIMNYFSSVISLEKTLFAGNKINNQVNIKGSDIANYNSRGNFLISDSKLQLSAASVYQNQDNSQPSAFAFLGSGNTFSNTDDGNVSSSDLAACAVRGIKLSGMVYHDGNGGYDGFDQKTDDLPGGLYISLMEDQKVITTVPVENGAFTMEGVLPGYYTLKLNIKSALRALDSEWSTSGEALMGWNWQADTDGDGALSLMADQENYEEIVFAINRRPVAMPMTLPIATPTMDQMISLDDTEQGLPGLKGSDTEDGETNYYKRFRISKLPKHGQLLVNFSSADTTSTFEFYPGALRIIFSGAGYDSLSFDYVMLDNSGAESAPATYTVKFDKPLPVVLQSFDAKAEGNTANLTWVTTMEQKADKFLIEHSVDGTSWKAVGNVAAARESVLTKTYHWTHLTPALYEGNLYRLKMVDLDGSFAYSSIRNVTFDQVQTTSVYPNPATDRVTIDHKNGSKVKTVTVTSAAGNIFYRSKATANQTIDLSRAQPGLYIIQMTNADGTSSSHKLIITR